MDLALLIIIAIILITVLVVTLLFIIIDYIYPDIISSNVTQGSANSGNDGTDGNDGNLGTPATLGLDGIGGVQGLPGKSGRRGDSGNIGTFGAPGVQGLSGTPGAVGLLGEPSNSIVPIMNRYDMKLTDSYIIQDTFTFDSVKYQMSLYTNIEKNTRFVLDSRVHIPLEDGFDLSPGFGGELEEVAAGNFFSNIRIAICYGRGLATSKDRSDDTIFYVSPPISRRSYLFRYKFKRNSSEEFKRVNNDYPISRLGNTSDFFYFRPETNVVSDDPNLSVDKFHLIKGIGRYELVVNTFPVLPTELKFSYRIIEEITNVKDSGFALPTITLPFNSSNLTYKDRKDSIAYPGRKSLDSITISNRFDLNRVIERDLAFDDVTWKQTTKRNVEMSIPGKFLKVQYDNTYISLNNSLTQSKLELEVNNNWGFGVTPLENAKLILPFVVKSQNKFLPAPFDFPFHVGVRRFNVSVPTIKFSNIEKLYLQFRIITRTGNIDQNDHIITYGEKYSLDLINFQSIYSKVLGIGKFYSIINGSYTNTDDGPLELDIRTPIKIGYTLYKTEERYVASVLPQVIREDVVNPVSMLPEAKNYYFVNIPLYGYKKV